MPTALVPPLLPCSNIIQGNVRELQSVHGSPTPSPVDEWVKGPAAQPAAQNGAANGAPAPAGLSFRPAGGGSR